MTKRDIKRFILFAFLAILLVGFTFFRKENNKEDNTDSTPEQINVIEKQKAENILSNFAIKYNSYTIGDFSNIESLYDLMTSELKKIEMVKVEEIRKQETEEKITVKSEFKGSNTIDFSENRIIANIVLSKQTYNGAFVADPGNPNQKILIDKNGQRYEKDFSTLLAGKDLIFIQLTGIKENGEWKISNIKDITNDIKIEYKETEDGQEETTNTEDMEANTEQQSNDTEEDDMMAE